VEWLADHWPTLGAVSTILSTLIAGWRLGGVAFLRRRIATEKELVRKTREVEILEASLTRMEAHIARLERLLDSASSIGSDESLG
jgi:hypothetical protein